MHNIQQPMQMERIDQSMPMDGIQQRFVMGGIDEPTGKTGRAYWFEILRLMWDSYPWLTVAMVITGVISGLASVAVIDTINTAIHNPDDRGQLLLAFIGLNIASIVLKNGSSLLPAYASMKVIASLQIGLCRKILTTPLEEIDKRGAPNVLTLLTNDIPILSQTLLLLPTILTEGAIFVFGIAYLAYLSWVVFLLTITAIIVGVVIHFFFLRKGMMFSRKARDEINTFNEHTYGLIFGIKELKLNGRRRSWFTRDGIEQSSKKVARYGFIEQLWFSGGSNIGPAAFAILLGVLIFGMPPMQVLDAPTLTACVLAILYILGPLGILIGAIPQLGQGTIACERLAAFGFSISNKKRQPLEREKYLIDEQPSVQSWKSIELRGIKTDYHDYESETCFELGPIDMRIHPCELVFIVGGNGSGKSTLAKILTGLYAPTEGQIFLDGQPINEENQDAYRSLFTTVFTDFHLFNQVLGSDKETDASALAHEYLAQLKLADKVQIVNDKYSTTKALSNGQRKRLALLCARLEDRHVYVLDEWAADQDPSFKRFFYEVLLPELKNHGKCVIVITHDDQYFRLADRIIKLSDGKIVSDSEMHSNSIKTPLSVVPETSA